MIRPFLPWLLLLAATPGWAQDVPMRSARMVFADGRSPQSATFMQLAAPAREWYIAGSDLADALNVPRNWRADVRKLVLRIGDQRITFTVGARAVVGADLTLMLRRAVQFHQGEPWVPLEFLTQQLSQFTERTVQWDEDAFVLGLGSREYNVTGYELQDGDLSTELRIQLSEPLAFRVDDSRQGVLEIKIYGGEVDGQSVRLTQPRGLIDAITPRQESGSAFVRVQLSELASRYQSLASDDAETIVLRIEQQPITGIPSPVPRGPKLVQILPPEAEGRRVTVRKVVLDPGHGGADTGRKAADGMMEKDVALAIALEVERLLRRRDDLDVVLTRRGDEELGLVERTEMANREQADVFISIHSNGWYDPTANGIETYFLSPAKSEWDAEVAREENASVAAAEDLDFILWDLVQSLYIQESATLAESIQSALVRETGLENRGVKQAGFRVLVGAYMPAVLVEVGFLSNPDDASRLAQSSFHRQVARALADAVLDFRDRMDAVREESK